ncbi:WAT1-related protein At1g68170-like [Telopea speciosissima]|uniref:WAT1-related protein At1g68170-like n=1 Tax=Telopea speciosissima TaxID=54955 RepID=UPI001CC74676|nr:WAT1-related protein At1g68170-like [Telopea speciosissima]
MVLTFYKGAVVNIFSTKVDLTTHHGVGSQASTSDSAHDRMLASLLSLGCCLCYGLWLIVQAMMSERYPCDLSSTALMCFMGSVLSVIYALCMGSNNWDEWKLGWNIRLWSVAYAGILATALIFTMIAWGVRARGAMFVAVFDPLELVAVSVMGIFLLDEKLHVGSLIGSALIVIGLYVALWGKAKETEMPHTSRDLEQIEVATSIPPSTRNNTLDVKFSDDIASVAKERRNLYEQHEEIRELK